jgi:23S rRNA (uridine2552-2'-O)-methyltransferase
MPRFNVQDRFFKKAKEQGLRARSAFKLEGVQNRFMLVRPGDKVLDLGAAPGSFMQFLVKVVGGSGKVVGVDLKRIEEFAAPNVFCFEGDVFEPEVYQRITDETGIQVFDVITSDLAPSTTGVRSVDAGRSFQLNEQVLAVADAHLKKGGNLVLKAFPGADHDRLLKMMNERFKTVRVMKPEAVRKSSREVYVVGLKKR